MTLYFYSHFRSNIYLLYGVLRIFLGCHIASFWTWEPLLTPSLRPATCLASFPIAQFARFPETDSDVETLTLRQFWLNKTSEEKYLNGGETRTKEITEPFTALNLKANHQNSNAWIKT